MFLVRIWHTCHDARVRYGKHWWHWLPQVDYPIGQSLALNRQSRHLGNLLQHHEWLLVSLIADRSAVHRHHRDLIFGHLGSRTFFPERKSLVLNIARAVGLY